MITVCYVSKSERLVLKMCSRTFIQLLLLQSFNKGRNLDFRPKEITNSGQNKVPTTGCLGSALQTG